MTQLHSLQDEVLQARELRNNQIISLTQLLAQKNQAKAIELLNITKNKEDNGRFLKVIREIE